MNNLLLIAKTEEGKKALKQGLKENTFTQRKLVKQWYELTTVKEEPFTLKLLVKTSLISPLAIAVQVESILEQNGATKDKDYKIKVET